MLFNMLVIFPHMFFFLCQDCCLSFVDSGFCGSFPFHLKAKIYESILSECFAFGQPG